MQDIFVLPRSQPVGLCARLHLNLPANLLQAPHPEAFKMVQAGLKTIIALSFVSLVSSPAALCNVEMTPVDLALPSKLTADNDLGPCDRILTSDSQRRIISLLSHIPRRRNLCDSAVTELDMWAMRQSGRFHGERRKQCH